MICNTLSFFFTLQDRLWSRQINFAKKEVRGGKNRGLYNQSNQIPEQRAKGYGNWEDRLPSPFLKAPGFWGESNIAWQKCLCAATLGRREESSGNLMKTGQALYIRPHGELWIIRAADKHQICNAKLKTTKHREHWGSTGADVLMVWASTSLLPSLISHPIPCRKQSTPGQHSVPPTGDLWLIYPLRKIKCIL